MLARVLTHLDRLVSFDTQNPPRAIGADHPALGYCAGVLEAAGCRVVRTDLGDGCVNLLATRGRARTVVNCHLDTVPADPSWTRDPFVLSVEGDDAIGLGACDVKGAAACVLAAVERAGGPVAVLFSTDEEAGQSRCVRAFTADPMPYERAIVCEPTGVRAVTRHRGLAAFEAVFTGEAGHSSTAGGITRNALHAAVRWAERALGFASREPFHDIRLNIGRIEGGTKANVSASSARVVFGIRPPPGMETRLVASALEGLVADPGSCAWGVRFEAPGLDEREGARAMVAEYALEPGEPVDFWTEAPFFAAAGLATVVLGPGEIGLAHAADESVPLGDLERAASAYARIFSDTTPPGGPGEETES